MKKMTGLFLLVLFLQDTDDDFSGVLIIKSRKLRKCPIV